MILTPRFVYIHLPKTGGTFVSTVLERLMKPPRPRNWPERVVGRIRKQILGRPWVDTNKHGFCCEIPEPYRGLPIAACVRNPFDRYVSQFEFGWWRTHREPWIDWEAIGRRFPSFPDIDFGEFLEVASIHFQRLEGSPLPPEDALGFHSEQFVRHFFRDPEGTWPLIDDAYIEERRWERDLFPVRFLRQESLNRDLHDFLLEVGFPPGEVAFVLEEGPILPEGSSRKGDRHWSDYYTPRLKALIRRRERLFLAVFPEYDGE
jgi:hypothetical protein